jgi:hypothetical protein
MPRVWTGTAGISRGLSPLQISLPIPRPAPPIAPSESNYSIPGGATVVSTQAALETALAGGTPIDIKINNGTYSRASELVPGAPHRLWCQTATGVNFNYGFRINYMDGFQLHGGNFNIADTAHAAVDGGLTAAVLSWFSAGDNTTITDVTIDGNHAITSGLQMSSPNHLIAQRCVIKNVTDYGIFASDNDFASTRNITTISDMDVSGVYRATRGAADGTAEAGVWVGHKVTNGVHRIRVNDIGWMGLWTGNNCNDTEFTDIDIDLSYSDAGAPVGAANQVAVYVEHYTRRCSFKRFRLGPEVITGLNVEWDNGLNVALTSGVTLPAATLLVADTTNFAASGTIYVDIESASPKTVTYTGKTGTSFTGCSGGTGTYPANSTIISDRPDGHNGGTDLSFEDGVIELNPTHTASPHSMGVMTGDGTTRVRVKNVVVRGYTFAAVVDNTRRHGGNTNASASNTTLTYRKISGPGRPGLSPKLISYNHPSGTP